MKSKTAQPIDNADVAALAAAISSLTERDSLLYRQQTELHGRFRIVYMPTVGGMKYRLSDSGYGGDSGSTYYDHPKAVAEAARLRAEDWKTRYNKMVAKFPKAISRRDNMFWYKT